MLPVCVVVVISAFGCGCFLLFDIMWLLWLQHNTRADGKMPPVSHTPVTPGGFNVETDEEWDEEDDTMDPDGKMAPLVGKRAGKVGSLFLS